MLDGTLTPADGRDYKSLKQVQIDFDAGKDFNLNTPGGRTIRLSKRDFSSEQETVQVRYKRGFMGFEKSGLLKIK